MKNLILLLSSLFLFSCVKGGGGNGGGTTSDGPKNPTSPTIANYTATVSSQPSFHGVVGQNLEQGPSFNFKDDDGKNVNPPKSAYTIRGYKDVNCSIPATGTLTFSSRTSGSNLLLEDVKYNRSEDIYIGVTGTRVSKACSRAISFMSSMPVSFSIIDGEFQEASVNTILPYAVKVLILDVNDNPVTNARVKVGNQMTGPSTSEGIASLNFRTGTEVGEDIEVPMLLSFNDLDLHSLPLYVTVKSDKAKKLDLFQQEYLSQVILGESFGSMELQALDEFNNPIHTDFWTFHWEAYSDPECTITSDKLSYEDIWLKVDMMAGVEGFDENDPEYWANVFVFSFSEVGEFYLKFYLEDPDTKSVVDSVCSEKVNVIPIGQ